MKIWRSNGGMRLDYKGRGVNAKLKEVRSEKSECRGKTEFQISDYAIAD